MSRIQHARIQVGVDRQKGIGNRSERERILRRHRARRYHAGTGMPTTGFFTDATLCIGCKACEVACKEWNDVPHDGFSFSGLSYDNTLTLWHSTWRHVKFVER